MGTIARLGEAVTGDAVQSDSTHMPLDLVVEGVTAQRHSPEVSRGEGSSKRAGKLQPPGLSTGHCHARTLWAKPPGEAPSYGRMRPSIMGAGAYASWVSRVLHFTWQ